MEILMQLQSLFNFLFFQIHQLNYTRFNNMFLIHAKLSILIENSFS